MNNNKDNKDNNDNNEFQRVIANGFTYEGLIITKKGIEFKVSHDTYAKRGYIARNGEIISSFLTDHKRKLIDFDGIITLNNTMIRTLRTAKVIVPKEFELI